MTNEKDRETNNDSYPRNGYHIELDGDTWVATAPGHINLQETGGYADVAFGKSPVEAINALLSRRADHRARLTWEETEKIYDLVDRIQEIDTKLGYGQDGPVLSGVEAQELLSTAVAGFLAAHVSEAARAEREKIAILEARIAELTKPYKPNYPEAKVYISEGPGLDSFLSDDQEPAICEWAFGGYLWSASCGATWEFPEGSPEDNKFRYCPNCGRPVKEV